MALLAFILLHLKEQVNGDISFTLFPSLPDFACRGGTANNDPLTKRPRKGSNQHREELEIKVGTEAERLAAQNLDEQMALYFKEKAFQRKTTMLNERIVLLQNEKTVLENYISPWALKNFEYPSGTAGLYVRGQVEQKIERICAIDAELSSLQAQVQAKINEGVQSQIRLEES